MAKYADITKIDAPSTASEGDVVTVDVSVKNIDVSDQYLAITAVFDSTVIPFQFDYLLVSDPLWAGVQAVGVERRGIYRQSAEGDPTKMFPEVKGLTSQASDHGAVWADIEV